MLTLASDARRVWRALVGIALVAAGWAAGTAARTEAALPDGRGYEMVSPAQKNGGDVMSDSARTRAASVPQGIPMAATFTSLTGFGDVHGTSVGTEYMSQRLGLSGTSGWTTHAITPRQDPLTFRANAAAGGDPFYAGDFAPDLSTGVYQAWAPITDAPNVADVANLYLRADLRSPGEGTYELLSDSATAQFPSLLKTSFAGASADFTHSIFESLLNLTTDATGFNPKLYEASGGTVSLVQVPSAPEDASCTGAACVPAPSAVAGQGQITLKYTPRVISSDGHRVIFSSPVNGSGGPIAFGPNTTRLYMRDNQGTADTADDTTVRLNVSQLPTPEDPPQAAIFQTASADGSRVFFLSSEQLTTEPFSGGTNLYMWDSTGAPGARLTRLSVASGGGPAGAIGVIGASADGHYVYFVASSPLLPGVTSNVGIYLWHDGSLQFVGGLANGADPPMSITGNWGLIPTTLRSRVAPDGKHLLFASTVGQDLLDPPYDQTSACRNNPSLDRRPGCTEYYVYSADTQTLRCASCHPDGDPATQDADVNSRPLSTGGTNTTWHVSHALSDDGRYVFFNSLDGLVPGDRNGRIDAYRFDVASGDVELISTGRSTGDSYFLDASADGRDVFFTTRERLVGWDRDQAYDLYDARIGGGFPEPPPPAPVCSGDSCQGDLAGLPADLAQGTTTFLGKGNLSQALRAHKKPRSCKRGFKRKRVHGHVRCVKRKRARAGHHVAHRAHSHRSGR